MKVETLAVQEGEICPMHNAPPCRQGGPAHYSAVHQLGWQRTGCRLSKRESKRDCDLFRGVLETAVSRWVKMVRVSVLHDALKTMCNAEKRGKRQVLIRPASKVVIKFLQLMQKHGYIGDFEFVDDHRAGKIVVSLNGRMNKCGCISPRYDVGHEVRSQALSYAVPKGVR